MFVCLWLFVVLVSSLSGPSVATPGGETSSEPSSKRLKSFDNTPQYCSSRHCKEVVTQRRKWMDPSISPCQDYYAYACMNFNNVNGRSQVDRDATPFVEKIFSLLGDPDALLKSFKTPSDAPNEDRELIKIVSEFYHACQKGGWEPIKHEHLWHSLMEGSSQTVEKDKLFSFVQHVGTDFLFSISVTDFEGASRIYITKPTNQGPLNPNNCQEMAQKWYPSDNSFQKMICNLIRDSDALDKSHVIDNAIVTLDSNSASSFSWSNLIYDVFGLRDHCQRDATLCKEIVVHSLPWWNQLNLMLKSYSTDVLVNALFGMIHMDGPIHHLNNEIIKLRSKESRHPGKKLDIRHCRDVTAQSFQLIFNRIGYFRSLRHDSWNLIQKVGNEIRATMIDVIAHSAMSHPYKLFAQHTIQNLKFEFGMPPLAQYPILLRELYKDIRFDRTNLLQSVIQQNTAKYRIYSEMLKRSLPNDLESHALFEHGSNFIYSVSLNTVFFAASDYDAKYILNTQNVLSRVYANFGTSLAHEMGHAILLNSMKYHKVERKALLQSFGITNFDLESTKVSFQKSCYIRKYEALRTPIKEENVQINGKKTFEEILADTVGFKVAYEAWKRVDKKPVLLRYEEESRENRGWTSPPTISSPAQQFVLAFAQSWCESEITYNREEDDHPPEFARVNGVLQNSWIFQEAYPSCPTSSPMNPVPKCQGI